MSAPSFLLLTVLIQPVSAQTCLALSTVVVGSGDTASLELSLDSSADSPPAALQWNLQYLPSAIRSLTVDDGPAATAASKTVMCAPSTAGLTCLIMGSNTKTIPNGVIAKITAVLASDTTTATIQLMNPLAASAEGYFMPASARSGTITTANVSADRRIRPPLRRITATQCHSTQ